MEDEIEAMTGISLLNSVLENIQNLGPELIGIIVNMLL